MSCPLSEVQEVWVQNADIGDQIDRQDVVRGRLADRFGTRPVVYAERLRPVVAHVRVEPCDALYIVLLDDTAARLCSRRARGKRKPVGERALDQVAGHFALLSLVGFITTTVRARP